MVIMTVTGNLRFMPAAYIIPTESPIALAVIIDQSSRAQTIFPAGAKNAVWKRDYEFSSFQGSLYVRTGTGNSV